jgi:hypothetical protein
MLRRGPKCRSQCEFWSRCVCFLWRRGAASRFLRGGDGGVGRPPASREGGASLSCCCFAFCFSIVRRDPNLREIPTSVSAAALARALRRSRLPCPPALSRPHRLSRPPALHRRRLLRPLDLRLQPPHLGLLAPPKLLLLAQVAQVGRKERGPGRRRRRRRARFGRHPSPRPPPPSPRPKNTLSRPPQTDRTSYFTHK